MTPAHCMRWKFWRKRRWKVTQSCPFVVSYNYVFVMWLTVFWCNMYNDMQPPHRTTTILWPFFRDHTGELVPEENFWTSWCKGRLTEASTPTIRLGATPSGLTSAHLHHPPIFLQARWPSCHPTNSVKALKATTMMCNLTTIWNI